MSSRRRGIYFKPEILVLLEAYSRRTGLNISEIVNIAVEYFFKTQKENFEEALKLETEREQLIREERRLFNELKVILRSGVYLEKEERDILLGRKPGIRPSERMAGILSKIPEEYRDAIMRIFNRRQEIANRLVEIERETLPESKRTVAVTERGLEIIPKVKPEEFIKTYVVTKTLAISYKT